MLPPGRNQLAPCDGEPTGTFHRRVDSFSMNKDPRRRDSDEPPKKNDPDVPMPPDDPARGPPVEEPPNRKPPKRAL
jgi:hypothetical protein